MLLVTILLLATCWAAQIESGQHFPRTFVKQAPFLGITEINDAKPLFPGSRQWKHKVHLTFRLTFGFLLKIKLILTPIFQLLK